MWQHFVAKSLAAGVVTDMEKNVTEEQKLRSSEAESFDGFIAVVGCHYLQSHILCDFMKVCGPCVQQCWHHAFIP